MKKQELLNYKFENLRSIVLAVTGQDVCVDTRQREVVDARRIFCHIIHSEKYSSVWKYEYSTGFGIVPTSYITTISIGKFLNRNHTSVLHMIKTCELVAEVDPEFKNLYDRVYSRFGEDLFKRLNYLDAAIEKLKDDLLKLERQREQVINLKKERDEEGKVSRQGVLFEVPYDNKSIEIVG
jgi:hypothetical protein